MNNADGMNQTPTAYPPECEAARVLIPAYALGLADPDEVAQVEAALRRCPPLADEVAQYRGLGDALLTSTDALTPPPRLRAQLLRAVAADPAATPTLPLPALHVLPRRRPPLSAALWIGVAGVVLALLVGGLLIHTLSQQAALSSRLGALSSRLDAQTAMLALFARDEVLRFELRSPQDAESAPRAVVYCNPDQTVGVIVAEAFPPSAQPYQVWLWRDGQRTPGGLLDVAEDGSGLLVFEAPQPFGTYQYIGVAPQADAGDEPPPALVRAALYIVTE